MIDDYFSSDADKKRLERALFEGLTPVDLEFESPVELFIRNEVIAKNIVTKGQMLECFDICRRRGLGSSLVFVLIEKGYLNKEQIKGLLDAYVKVLPGALKERFLAEMGDNEREPEKVLRRWIAIENKERGYWREDERDSAIKEIDERFIGKRIGSYEILERIGKGGMGAVYRARHITLNRIVAIKIMSPALVGEKHKVRFLREARAVARLEHPNIVVVHDAGEEDRFPYIVMQLVEGKSVREIVEEKGRLTGEESLRIVESAARALDAAHKNGIVHRDIKPDNIMITKEGEVKLTDFGLARSMEEDDMAVTGDGVAVGTPYYMSPEQFEGERVDKRSDIYSLGATLYYMLTGKPPFTGNTIFQLRDKHLKSPLPPLDTFINNVHPGLSYIVSRMLAKSPDMRYQNMNELMADLGRVFDALTGKGEGKEFAYYLDRHKVGKHLKRRLFVGLILVAVVITLILLQMYRVKNGGRQGADDGVRVNERELEAIVEELLKRYERELMAQRTRSIQERLKESIGERIDGLAKEGGWDAAKKEDVRRVAFRMTEKLFELFGVNWEEWVVPVSENREEIEKIEKELETELNGIIGKEETEKLLHLLRDILIPLGALKRTSP